MRLEKIAVVPGGDPAAMGGGAPPMDPAAMAMGAAPPVDPAAMAGAAAPMDPATMGAAPAPPPQPAAPVAPGQAAPQKLKPEQMMNMLDYRLYNMQQQLTAIMHALGVQVAPESLVLPPGSQGAPQAESALPGGPMAPPPPQQDPGAPAGPQAPGGPLPPGGPMPPNAPPTDPAAMKGASAHALHVKASAVALLQRSLSLYAG